MLSSGDYESTPIKMRGCQNFTLYTGCNLAFNMAKTYATSGSIGYTARDDDSSESAISGKYELEDGETESDTPKARTCGRDLVLSQTEGYSRPCKYLLTSEMKDYKLKPSVYCSSSSTFTLQSLGILTLDSGGVSDGVYIFKTKYTLITGQRSSIVMVNGTAPGNVFWSVGTSATIGHYSSFVGQILAGTSINYGYLTRVVGRGLSSCSVSFASGTRVGQIEKDEKSEAIIGSCSKKFAVLAGTSVTFGSGQSVISKGSIGIYPGTSISGDCSLKNGTTEKGTTSADAAVKEISRIFNIGSTLQCKYPQSTPDLSDKTLTCGVYCSSAGSFYISQMKSVVLDGRDEVDGSWIFQTATTLTLGSSSSVILKNGASSSRVYWLIGTAAEIGYSSFIAGNILSYGSIVFKHYSSCEGRALSATGVSLAGYCSLNVPDDDDRECPIVIPRLKLFLGASSNMVILAGTSILLAGAKTYCYSGSIGVSPGTSIRGNYLLDAGVTESGTVTASNAAADLSVALSAASNAICTNNLVSNDLSGSILTAGVYCSGTLLLNSWKSLTLNAGNDVDALWLFKASSTITTSSRSYIILLNGAQSKNVWWYAGSTVTVGVSSIFIGNILAVGSITLSERSVCEGHVWSSAAVTVNSGSWVDLATRFITETVSIGTCSDFAAFAGTSITFNGASSTINSGSIGVSPTSSISGLYTLQNGLVHLNTPTAISCAADMRRAYNNISVATCTAQLSSSELSGRTLSAGVYCTQSGAMTIASVLTLDGGSNSVSQWIFQVTTTLITSPSSSVLLINGAKSSNIWWSVSSSVSIGSSSIMVGNILTYTSISFGLASSLEGRALAVTTVTYAGACSGSAPPANPTAKPTTAPTAVPSTFPTQIPSITPTSVPTSSPSSVPSVTPTYTSVYHMVAEVCKHTTF